jgi:hypothetical protein
MLGGGGGLARPGGRRSMGEALPKRAGAFDTDCHPVTLNRLAFGLVTCCADRPTAGQVCDTLRRYVRDADAFRDHARGGSL